MSIRRIHSLLSVFQSYAGALAILSIIFFGTGCYEVDSEFRFPEFKPQIVIDARVTNIAGEAVVEISRTSHAESIHVEEKITNASVKVYSNDSSWVFTEQNPGIYSNEIIKATPGDVLTIEVKIDSILYKATDTMQLEPIIDSLKTTLVKNDDGELLREITIFTQKNSNKIQFYRGTINVNGVLKNDYYDLLLIEDEYVVNNRYFVFPYTFTQGDTVQIDIYSLSKPVYEFYYAMQMLGEVQLNIIQPPAINPVGNFSPEIIGCFQVLFHASTTVIVP